MKSLIDYYMDKAGVAFIDNLAKEELKVLIICGEFIIDNIEKEKEALKKEMELLKSN